jgi:hypothetical protein
MHPGTAPTGVAMISLQDFVDRAAAQPQVKSLELVTDQFAAALGGISNLYLLQAAKQGTDHLDVQTFGGFASDLVPREDILQVIHDCAGVNRKRSKPLLAALESTLDAYAEGCVGRQFQLASLGRFRRVDESHYEFLFRDPDSRG